MLQRCRREATLFCKGSRCHLTILRGYHVKGRNRDTARTTAVPGWLARTPTEGLTAGVMAEAAWEVHEEAAAEPYRVGWSSTAPAPVTGATTAATSCQQQEQEDERVEQEQEKGRGGDACRRRWRPRR